MSDFAIPEEQAIKMAYAEMVAQSSVIKKRNLHLEKKNTDNQQRIKDFSDKLKEEKIKFVDF